MAPSLYVVCGRLVHSAKHRVRKFSKQWIWQVLGKKGVPLAKEWFHIRNQLNPGVNSSPIFAQWGIVDEKFASTQSCAEQNKYNHQILVPVRSGRAGGEKIDRLTTNLMSKQVRRRIYHSSHLDKFSQFENISMVRLGYNNCQGSALKRY